MIKIFDFCFNIFKSVICDSTFLCFSQKTVQDSIDFLETHRLPRGLFFRLPGRLYLPVAVCVCGCLCLFVFASSWSISFHSIFGYFDCFHVCLLWLINEWINLGFFKFGFSKKLFSIFCERFVLPWSRVQHFFSLFEWATEKGDKRVCLHLEFIFAFSYDDQL